jgi:SHS2 domain-containing protein
VEERLFREIDHTADLGIEVEGETTEELFRRAGLALFSLMVSLEGVEIREEREVSVEAEGWEDLLHGWLSELLHIFLGNGFIAQTIEVTEITSDRVKARLLGEKLDFKRHDFYTEIKAVTYHQLSVTQNEDGRWQARVIFDV